MLRGDQLLQAANKLLERKNMLKQKETARIQKYNQLSLCKRMTLVTAMLLSGGSLATLVPSQAAYAHSNKPNTHHYTGGHKGHSTPTASPKLLIVCQSGNGGQGGSATKKSSGASGGPGGNCMITVPINVFLTIQHNKRHK
jgi:hypothetical protein